MAPDPSGGPPSAMPTKSPAWELTKLSIEASALKGIELLVLEPSMLGAGRLYTQSLEKACIQTTVLLNPECRSVVEDSRMLPRAPSRENGTIDWGER